MQCPKCNIEIKDHPANACINDMFATEVMKWKKILDFTLYRWQTEDGRNMLCHKFKPSTNISHAMEGVEKRQQNPKGLESSDWWFEMSIRPTGWCVNVIGNRSDNIYAETAPLAITRALILWAMEKK